MIFIDTSAIVSILLQGPDSEILSDKIEAAPLRYTAGHCKLEACMVLATRLKVPVAKALQHVNALLERDLIVVLDFTDADSEVAIRAFDLYGKGRKTKAQLNLADCMSYAFAKSRNLKMLHTGGDFKGTDVKSA